MCVIMQTFVAIAQTVAQMWEFFDCQNGGHPPFWILEF